MDIVGWAQVATAAAAIASVFIVWHQSRKALVSAERLTRESRIKDLRSDLFDRSLETARLLAQVSGVFTSTHVVEFGWIVEKRGLWQYVAPTPGEVTPKERTVTGLSLAVDGLGQVADLCFVIKGIANGINRDLTQDVIDVGVLDGYREEATILAAWTALLIEDATREPFHHPLFDDEGEVSNRGLQEARRKHFQAMPIRVTAQRLTELVDVLDAGDLRERLDELMEFERDWAYGPGGKPDGYGDTMHAVSVEVHTDVLRRLAGLVEQMKDDLAVWVESAPMH